ncbi:MAG: hypothetical protein IJ872_03955 [Eubacterium sp.]|nr:hypothetical protein [Eubacterium sp.]
MNEIFKFIFELLTDPLGLPIDKLQEYAILAVIGLIAYLSSYRIVGIMYDRDMLVTRTGGSFMHWTIRFVLFFGMWAIARIAIWLYRFVAANWITVLSIAIGTLLLAWIVKRTIFFMKFYKSLDGDKNA